MIKGTIQQDDITLVHIDTQDLIDIFTAFHPKAAEYKYFSSTHGTFSRIDYMLGYETSFNKFKIEISSSIFSDSPMKLEINQEQWNARKDIEAK